MKVLVATTNMNKFFEIQSIAPSWIELLSLSQFEQVPKVEEYGNSFVENSIIKAVNYANFFQIPVIADDSGLAIDALDGKPGLQSARFMEGQPYRIKMARILEQLKGVENRNAAFHCAASFYDPKTSILLSFEGIIKGSIALEIRGEGGFGYDPIFVPLHRTKTFGELPQDLKNAISHRARAFRGLFHLISSVFHSRDPMPSGDRAG